MSYKNILVFTKEEKEKAIITFISVILFIVCFSFASWIIPKHCSLFDDNIMPPQICHTIPMPENCHFCEDRAQASTASTIAGLGFCFFLLPVVVFGIRRLRNNPEEQTKLFDNHLN